MAQEDTPFDAPPSKGELARIHSLSAEQIEQIDRALLAGACDQWRKVARIVGTVMSEESPRLQGVPDSYYSQRIATLVERGLLQSQGDLRRMRYSEVRVSASAAK